MPGFLAGAVLLGRLRLQHRGVVGAVGVGGVYGGGVWVAVECRESADCNRCVERMDV